MQLNPTPIYGLWDDGRALDRHISSSEFIGYNEYGHAQFDTTRTELGELLYRLKYKGDQSAIVPIAQTAFDYIQQWQPRIDVIAPVPASKIRALQPLFQIVDAIGGLLNVPVDKTSIVKTKATPELKNLSYAQRLEVLAGAHSIEGNALSGRSVLLLDDLYQSGATLNAIARLLKGAGGSAAVFALALTRSRN